MQITNKDIHLDTKKKTNEKTLYVSIDVTINGQEHTIYIYNGG